MPKRKKEEPQERRLAPEGRTNGGGEEARNGRKDVVVQCPKRTPNGLPDDTPSVAALSPLPHQSIHWSLQFLGCFVFKWRKAT